MKADRYYYIGKDGKTVLARDLEDERDTLRARLEAVEKERDEALNQLDSARHSVDVLEKRVATARRDALLEAAKICDCRDREKDDSMYLAGCIDASQANAKRIRALANEAET